MALNRNIVLNLFFSAGILLYACGAYSTQANRGLTLVYTPGSPVIKGVAVKYLTVADIEQKDQTYKISAIKDFQNLVGLDEKEFQTKFIYSGDKEILEQGQLKWVNSSKNSGNAKYKFSFNENSVIKIAKPHDPMALVLYGNDKLLFIVVPHKSKQEEELFEALEVRNSIPLNGQIMQPQIEGSSELANIIRKEAL